MVFMYSTRYSYGILKKLKIFWTGFKKILLFHENASSVSRVIRRTDTDMTKLTVTFRNFANVPEEYCPLNTPLTFHKKIPTRWFFLGKAIAFIT